MKIMVFDLKAGRMHISTISPNQLQFLHRQFQNCPKLLLVQGQHFCKFTFGNPDSTSADDMANIADLCPQTIIINAVIQYNSRIQLHSLEFIAAT